MSTKLSLELTNQYYTDRVMCDYGTVPLRIAYSFKYSGMRLGIQILF